MSLSRLNITFHFISKAKVIINCVCKIVCWCGVITIFLKKNSFYFYGNGKVYVDAGHLRM